MFPSVWARWFTLARLYFYRTRRKAHQKERANMADNKIDPVAQAAYFKKIKDERDARHKSIARFADKDGNVSVRITYKGEGKISKGTEKAITFFDIDDTLEMDIAKADVLQERGFIEVVRPAKAVKAK